MNELIEMYKEDLQEAKDEINKLAVQLDYAQEIISEYYFALYAIRSSIEIYGNRKGRINRIKQELDSVDIFLKYQE